MEKCYEANHFQHVFHMLQLLYFVTVRSCTTSPEQRGRHTTKSPPKKVGAYYSTLVQIVQHRHCTTAEFCNKCITLLPWLRYSWLTPRRTQHTKEPQPFSTAGQPLAPPMLGQSNFNRFNWNMPHENVSSRDKCCQIQCLENLLFASFGGADNCPGVQRRHVQLALVLTGTYTNFCFDAQSVCKYVFSIDQIRKIYNKQGQICFHYQPLQSSNIKQDQLHKPIWYMNTAVNADKARLCYSYARSIKDRYPVKAARRKKNCPHPLSSPHLMTAISIHAFTKQPRTYTRDGPLIALSEHACPTQDLGMLREEQYIYLPVSCHFLQHSARGRPIQASQKPHSPGPRSMKRFNALPS